MCVCMCKSYVYMYTGCMYTTHKMVKGKKKCFFYQDSLLSIKRALTEISLYIVYVHVRSYCSISALIRTISSHTNTYMFFIIPSEKNLKNGMVPGKHQNTLLIMNQNHAHKLRTLKYNLRPSIYAPTLPGHNHYKVGIPVQIRQ